MAYQKLAQALNDSVKMYTPDVLYPRECLIVNVNEDDTLKIKVNIGENIYLDEVRYIGIPKIDTTGLFIPLNNNYDEGYCICYNETIESLTENVIINNYGDSVTGELNEIKEFEEETSDEISDETFEEIQTNINYDRRYAKINHTHTENVGTIEDLKTLIKNTKEGNILSLDKNFRNERYGNIIINKKIIIDGNGHSIENISFTCDTNEIELNNIVFFNVTTNRVNGGVLQLNGQKISINNCIFYNNIINGTSVYEGGAISVNTSSIETKITDCYFISNFCSNNGGAIRWIANNGILIGCKFIGNTATNSGGAIKWLGTNGLIRDCLFKNNKSNNAKDILTTDENLMGIGNKFLTESDIIGSEKFYDYITEFDKKEIEDEIHSNFGKNILYNTQEMIVNEPPNNISYYEDFRKNKVVYFDDESSNENGYRDWYYDITTDEFNYNDEFTFSFWVKSDKENVGKVKAYFTGGTDYIKTKVIGSNGYDSLDIFSDGHITFDVNDEWKKCFVSWKLNSTGVKIYKRIIIRIFDNAKIYLSSPKLERGKVSTDWTPNPNDKVSNYQIIGREFIDLNNIWKTGIYRCLTVNEAKLNIGNLPLDFQLGNAIPFVLEVIETGDYCCKQRITFSNNVKTFEYVRTMQNFNWSQWQIVENQVNCICYTSNITGSSGFGKLLKIKNILPTTNYNATIGFDVYQKNKKFPVRCYLKFKNENVENFNIDSFYYYGENSDIYIINSKDKEWDLYVKKSDDEDTIEIKNLTINDSCTTKENKLEFYPLGQEINNNDFISIYDETDTHSAKAIKSDYCLDKGQTDKYYLSLNGGRLNGDLNINGDLNFSNKITKLSTSSTDNEILSANGVYDEIKKVDFFNVNSWESEDNHPIIIDDRTIIKDVFGKSFLKYEFTHNKNYTLEFDFCMSGDRGTILFGGNRETGNWYEIEIIWNGVGYISLLLYRNGSFDSELYNTNNISILFFGEKNKIKMVRKNRYVEVYINDVFFYEVDFDLFYNIFGLCKYRNIKEDNDKCSMENIKIYNDFEIYSYEKVETDEQCKNRWKPFGQYQGLQNLTNTSFSLLSEAGDGFIEYFYDGDDFGEPITITIKLNNDVGLYASTNSNDLYSPTNQYKINVNTSKTFTLNVYDSVYVRAYGTGSFTANVSYEVKDIMTSTVNGIVDIIYPVGSIYMSVNNVNPNVLFGGRWEQLKDRFLLGSGNTYTGGNTGGSSTVALTKAQMPRHTHTQAQHRHKQPNKYSDGNTGSTGGYTYTSNRSVTDHYTDYQTPVINHTGGTGTTNVDANGSPHDNMPPYLVVYMWKRIG